MSDHPQSHAAPGVKSLLTRRQRAWLGAALALSALLLANTLYLLGNRATSLLPGGPGERVAEGTYAISTLFQVMVLSHTGLGFVVVALLLVFSVWHLPRVWARHRRRNVMTGLAFLVAGLTLAVTGPFIMFAAASREHTWVWWIHVVAGALVPITYVVHRSVSFVRPPRRSYVRFVSTMLVSLGAMVVSHGLSNREVNLTAEARLARDAGTVTGPGSPSRGLAPAVDGAFVPIGMVPTDSPFFPSPATTTTGDYLPARIVTRNPRLSPASLAADLDAIGFVVNEQIGADTCVRCHADTVAQWAVSAHRFSSFNNPFYEATINLLRNEGTAMTEGVARHIESFPQWRDRAGMIKSKWCAACHDPAVMLPGSMTEPIDRSTIEAQAGLTCLACHAIDRIHNNTGNGNYNIADEQEDPYLFAAAAAGTVAAYLHDIAIKAKPEVHKRQLRKPIFGTSEYCATCHKVSLQEAVNDYRWLRAQNEYDNWHDSGVALNAARTFYLPLTRKVCQDCHMPYEPAPLGDLAAKNGMVRSHRFTAVNTALPFIRGDTETIERTETFLQAEKLRIDVFALTRQRSDGDHETTYALDAGRATLVAGESVTLEVVVRNVGVGHTFPGGTNDSNQGWIELTVVDGQGRQVAAGGLVGEDGYVDPSAHFFRAVLVDREGRAIHQRNAQDIYATVYANVIGPGTAHVVHYRIVVPDRPGEVLTVRARLLWRKFDRAYTEFAYRTNAQGFKRFDQCPDLPITRIASSEVTLPISGSQLPADDKAAIDSEAAREDWMRFNDYGIGLLLQADTRGAENAFAKVVELTPDRVDGHRNLARVALRDGDLDNAYQHLLRCEELASNDPQTAWFWGVLLQEEGRYVEAASAYRRVLQHFPDDRAVWRNLGRTFYLDGKFADAVAAMQNVLRIDPEDRVAHYHVMLSARTLGDAEGAAAAEEAYLLYKLDESAAEVTRTYRLSHPHDNLEAQAIHVHDLSAPGRPRGESQGETVGAAVDDSQPRRVPTVGGPSR